MNPLTLDDLHKDVVRVEVKVDLLTGQISSLNKELKEVDARTSKTSLFMGAIASLLVAVAAIIVKGCV